jgi:multiple sugar transport system ATP-binding protein
VGAAKSKDVIIGIRPEHFEDAALVGDAPGALVTVPVDLVESMGSDVYAYFTVRGGAAASGDLDELAKDTGQDMRGEGTQINARLDAAANVQAGKEARLWIDTDKMQVFDAESGANLTTEDFGAHARA